LPKQRLVYPTDDARPVRDARVHGDHDVHQLDQRRRVGKVVQLGAGIAEVWPRRQQSRIGIAST
jgi:hypothetical protein